MTTYYVDKNGGIINNHDISRAYKQTDESVPFGKFREHMLRQLGAVKADVTADDLILAGKFHEAAMRFQELTGCSFERAKNTVRHMSTDLGVRHSATYRKGAGA